MRSILAAAFFAMALTTPAAAQDSDFSGTWAFQTEPYGSQQFGVVMSGAAVLTPVAPDRYDIALLAQELIVDRASGQSQVISARQSCTGNYDGAQFTIACELAEEIEGYAPDNFLLQPGEDGRLVGVLDSAASSQVTFTRLR